MTDKALGITAEHVAGNPHPEHAGNKGQGKKDSGYDPDFYTTFSVSVTFTPHSFYATLRKPSGEGRATWRFTHDLSAAVRERCRRYETLRGSFGFTFSGTANTPGGPSHRGGVGRFVFDGLGNLIGTVTSNSVQTIFPPIRVRRLP